MIVGSVAGLAWPGGPRVELFDRVTLGARPQRFGEVGVRDGQDPGLPV